MRDSAAADTFRVIERSGPAGRCVLQGGAGERVKYWVLAGYRGPELPALVTDPTLVTAGSSSGSAQTWRLSSREGTFEFQARAVDQIDEWPALYEPLHRSFALAWGDRLALRALLALLRLPGGARVLRLWHARRRR